MRVVECDMCCPECGAWHYDTQLISFYTGGWRQWSDGYGFGNYGRPDSGLRICTCGSVFQSNSVERRRPLRRRYWSLWKLRHLSEPLLPKPRRVNHENAHLILNAGTLQDDKAIERQLRTMAWWQSNMPQRDIRPVVSRTADTSQDSRERVLEEERSLEKLILLLSDEASPDWMMLGEVFRSLGRFDEAISSYRKIDQGPTIWVELLLERAQHCCRKVVELPQPGEN